MNNPTEGWEPQRGWEPPPGSPVTGGWPPATGPAGGSPSGGGGRGFALAGIVAGVVVLALVGVGVVLLEPGRGGDGPTPVTAEADALAGPETADPADGTPERDPARYGTAIRGVELRRGDCVDFDTGPGLIDTFDLLDCDAEHLAEVVGLIPVPDATADTVYPGADALLDLGTGCGDVASDYVGADQFSTTLVYSALWPDSTDWSDGMYQVACLAREWADGPLTRSVFDAPDPFARSDRVAVSRLRVGDCFQPDDGLSPAEVADFSEVSVVPCAEDHIGLFFGRAELNDFGVEVPYPGDDAIVDATGIACDEQFRRWFGVETLGFSYTYWAPTAASWVDDDRAVLCAVMDGRGLPADLAYGDFQAIDDLPVGTCYLVPPNNTIDTLTPSSRVATVECSAEHNGEMFGRGELPEGSYPGPDPADQDVRSRCIRHFTAAAGQGPQSSPLGDFRFWSPAEETWDQPDGRRYQCSVLLAEPVVDTLAEPGA